MDEQGKNRWTCWIAFGIVVIISQGLVPGSLIGGIAGIKTAEALYGDAVNSDMITKFFVLAGTIIGLAAVALVVMTLVMAVQKTGAAFFRNEGTEPGKDSEADVAGCGSRTRCLRDES